MNVLGLILLCLFVDGCWGTTTGSINSTKFIPCPEVAEWYECPDGIIGEEGAGSDPPVHSSHARARQELEQQKRRVHHKVRGE